MSNIFAPILDGDNACLANLRIKDSEYIDDCKKYSEIAMLYENVFNRYLATLDSLDVLDGVTADNIKQFRELVYGYMNGGFRSILASVAGNMRDYITDIDRADADIF